MKNFNNSYLLVRHCIRIRVFKYSYVLYLKTLRCKEKVFIKHMRLDLWKIEIYTKYTIHTRFEFDTRIRHIHEPPFDIRNTCTI